MNAPKLHRNWSEAKGGRTERLTQRARRRSDPLAGSRQRLMGNRQNHRFMGTESDTGP